MLVEQVLMRVMPCCSLPYSHTGQVLPQDYPELCIHRLIRLMLRQAAESIQTSTFHNNADTALVYMCSCFLREVLM